MEELEIPDLFAGFNGEGRLLPVPVIREPLGIVVKIDNEEDFRHCFDKEGDIEVFTQILSQIVGDRYRKDGKIDKSPLVPYKEDGDIMFYLNEVKIGKLYGGYVLVAHYEYASTVS